MIRRPRHERSRLFLTFAAIDPGHVQGSVRSRLDRIERVLGDMTVVIHQDGGCEGSSSVRRLAEPQFAGKRLIRRDFRVGLRPRDKDLIPKDSQGWRFLAIIDTFGRSVDRGGSSEGPTGLFRSRKEDGAGFLVFLHPDSRNDALLIDLHRWPEDR